MKVGIIHFMAYPQTMKGEGPILETLEKIAADEFFDCVEITTIKDDKVREEARDLLATSGLTVAYGAQPRLLGGKLDLNHGFEAERQKAVAEMKAAIDEAKYMGAVGCAFLSGKDAPDESGRPAAWGRLKDSVLELCAYAEGLPLVMESFDYDVDKCCLAGPNAACAEFVRDVRQTCPQFGLMVDLSHFPLQHEATDDALEAVKDVLVHAHMGNCVMKDGAPGTGDQHPRFGYPNSENDAGDVAAYLQGLQGIGYLGPSRPLVSFEVKPAEGECPDLVVANAKRTLKDAWARMRCCC